MTEDFFWFGVGAPFGTAGEAVGSRTKGPGAQGVPCSEVGLKEEREGKAWNSFWGIAEAPQLANFLLPSLQLMQ